MIGYNIGEAADLWRGKGGAPARKRRRRRRARRKENVLMRKGAGAVRRWRHEEDCGGGRE